MKRAIALISLMAAAAAISSASAAATLKELNNDITALVQRNQDSVVEIRVERKATSTEALRLLEKIPGLDNDDGQRLEIEMTTTTGVGSGFVLDEEGYILTTRTVTDGALDVKVVLKDGTELPAEVMASDPIIDVAVIKVEGGQLRPATLGDSEDLEPGAVVVSIGNQGSLNSSVSLGLVSGVDRSIQDRTGLVQISGVVGPGGSGSPVFDSSGRVVAMTVAMTQAPVSTAWTLFGKVVPNQEAARAIERLRLQMEEEAKLQKELQETGRISLSDMREALRNIARQYMEMASLYLGGGGRTPEHDLSVQDNRIGDGVSFGFGSGAGGLSFGAGTPFALSPSVAAPVTTGNTSLAIPINAVKPYLDDLKSGKPIKRGWLGAVVLDSAGAIILDPVDNGPADKAGIQDGDRLVQADGKEFRNSLGFVSYVRGKKPGETIKITIEHAGKKNEVSVRLAEQPEHAMDAGKGSRSFSFSTTIPPKRSFALDLQNAGIQEVASALSKASGANVMVVDPDKIGGRVTLHLTSTTLHNAIELICESLDCEYVQESGAYVIRPKG